MAHPPGGPPPQPPYGSPPPPGGPPPPPGGPPPSGSRWRTPGGITTIVLAGLAALLLIGVLVTFVLVRPAPVTHEQDAVAHEGSADCAGLETDQLAELVPDAETTEEELDDQEGFDQLNCEWESSADASGVPGYATILMIRNDSTSGWESGDSHAEEDLQSEVSEHDTTTVDDLGTAAYSYYDDEHQVGCVATQTDNVFLRTCYDSAQDFFDLESVPEDEATDGAVELGTALVEHIEAQEY